MRALVIGCGRIGATWDRPGDPAVITHAHAYRRNPRIGALAFVDPSPEAARLAAERWGAESWHTDLDAALAEGRPDIASVCLPDDGHQAVLERLLEAGVPVIQAEKPLTTGLEGGREIARRAREAGIVINVNYSRRFDPEVARLRAELRRGDHGRPLNAVAHYTKGLLHNGSHLVDLLRHLLGEVEDYRPLCARPGYGPADPTLDCWLRLADCPSAHLVGLEEDRYSIIEADILCEKSRIRFTRFGFRVETQAVRNDPIFPGYRDLADPEPKATGLGEAMTRYLEDSLRARDHSHPPLCPADDAWRTQKACLDILAAFEKEKPRA